MFKKAILFLLLSVSSTFTSYGQDINLCESTPEHIWLYCKDQFIGECFDLNTICFTDREYICRKKWEELKIYDHRSIKPNCRKRNKVCKVVTCDISLPPDVSESPTISPTFVPSFSPTENKTISPTSIPTSSPTENNKTFVPTSSPTETNTPTAAPTSDTVSPTSIPTNSPTFSSSNTDSPTSSLIPSKSPTLRTTKSPTRENNDSNTEYLLFTLLVVPLIIACITKPNVCVRWWRIITCWSRRHPDEQDRTEAPPEGHD